ncbi:MAG: hypothetical protein IJ574_04825 [Bacilli bacterium]|nr:hypothetical protein [Bacilli bacterium]
MKVINLSKKQFSNLEKINIPEYVSNTEADLYDFKYKRQSKVLKALYTLNGQDFANKLYTLEMLDYYKDYLPEECIIPDSLVAVNNTITAFTMPKVDGINLKTILINNYQYTKEEQVYYLQLIGQLLEKLCNMRKYTRLNNFYINDLHAGNFVVNPINKTISSVDLDSSKIANNDGARYLFNKSLVNSVQGKYNIRETSIGYGYVEADENSDLYCYNLMILEYLSGSNIDNMDLSLYYNYIEYLRYIGINEDLLSSFLQLLSNKDNINPYHLLNTLTDEQLFRAKANVYNKVKRK